MPRHDWRDDDLMSRDRSPDSGYSDYEDRDRGGFFGGDQRELSMRQRRSGWGDMMRDESSGSRRPMRERSRDCSYGPDDERRDIPRDETERLIASNKVEGTPVYDRYGERLGSIHNFMVDKFRGQVVYAVLRYSSGFLGLDHRYIPLDWDDLTFDTRLGGYHVDITEDQLKNSGSWDRNERWSERSRHASGREDERYGTRRQMGEAW